VLFCCGGTAHEIMHARGEPALVVPALRHAMRGNVLQYGRTFRKNGQAIRKLPQVVTRLADELTTYRPDLLITDFEAFSPRAARRIGLPVLSFNHQQIITETRYTLPASLRLQALVAMSVIKVIAPSKPEHLLLSSFFFPPLKHPSRTTLVPPIIRPAVQNLQPRQADHVLVYYNQPDESSHVLDQLRRIDAEFIVYNFDPPGPAQTYPNLVFKQPSLDGFLADLASSKAVVCTAGFTLISEALYLGKPLLVVPNRGIFEQTLNALFLQRENLGEAVLGRSLQRQDLSSFLSRCDRYAERLRNRPACGNKEAVACIEGVLSRLGPSLHTRPPLPYRPVATASLTDAMAGSE